MATQTPFHNLDTYEQDEDDWSHTDTVERVDEEVPRSGPLADRPADPPVGRRYYSTDVRVLEQYDPDHAYSDASGWFPLAGLGTLSDPVPATAHFSDITLGGDAVATETWATANNIAHADLADAPTDAHHTRYADSEAVAAVEGTVNVADLVSGSASSGDVPEADGAGGVTWSATSGSGFDGVADNLSITNWNVIDVGNNGFPGDRTGGDLAQFIRDNYDSTGHTVFKLPEGTYEWQQTLMFDDTDLAIPQGFAIVGEPEATIYCTSGVQADQGRCIDFGDAYGSATMSNVYIANLHFDVGNEDDTRDAGIGRHRVGRNFYAENLSITRRYRRNDDGSTNGDRFIWRMNVGDPEATAYCRNFDFTAGERYNSNNDHTVGHTIPISAENAHNGKAVYEGCAVAGTVDNGFYLKDSAGTCVVRDCYARNCGGGGIRVGRNDRVEACHIEYTTAADYYGAALWIQEGQATSVDGCRIDVPVNINDCIRFTDLMGGVDLANIQVELDNTGDFVIRDSNTSAVNEGVITFRDSTIHDACDGSVREGGIEMRNHNWVLENLTYYQTGGRIPISTRYSGHDHKVIRDSYFEVADTGIARAGSSLDAPDVDYVFEGCKFVNTGTASDPGLIWDDRASNSLLRLVIRDCDCRDFPSLFSGTDTLSDYNVGELRSNLGYANAANNSYTGP